MLPPGTVVREVAETLDDRPLLVPEVNADHLGLLELQRHHHGWTGGIVCNANCTATVLVMALAPLHAAFGVEIHYRWVELRHFLGLLRRQSAADEFIHWSASQLAAQPA